jgi:D-amino peptidase
MTHPIGTLVAHSNSGRGIVLPRISEFPGFVTIQLLDRNGWPTSTASMNQTAADREWSAVPPPTSMGRILIMADMEGISGVPNDESAVTPAEETGGTRTPIYSSSCRSMTLDVQMVIAGARAAGAKDIIVADTHWHDTNLTDEDFDVPVVRGSQAAIHAMHGAQAVIMIGWHAKAGTPVGFLPHTYTDRIARLFIDGREVGELGMLARIASSVGVPVLMVSGDTAAADEAARDIGSCRAVGTKTALPNGETKMLAQHEAWRQLVGHAYGAIREVSLQGKKTVLLPHEPGVFEVEVRPGYGVDGDHEAVSIGNLRYRISGANIRESYAAFQRFVERLPSMQASGIPA